MRKNMVHRVFKAGKYLRLSIEDGDKAESESIINQSILIDSFIENNPDITITDIFKDDGYTGTDFNRPGFQAMMEAVENGSINCIIVKDLSRFGREHIDVDRYIQKIFPRRGVRFISVNDHYDSLTANESETHLVLPVKSFVNDSYSRDISIKVRSNLEAKRQNGDYVGAYVSYGYLKDKKDKNKLAVDLQVSENVVQMFQWKLDGLSCQMIADKLNTLGILSPAEHKKKLGINYRSAFQRNMKSMWSAVAVGRILRNPIYIGTLEQGKTSRVNYKVKEQRRNPEEKWSVKENNHKPIIEKSTFDLVQQLLEKDMRVAPGKEANYMFAGLLECGDCGRNLIRRKKSYKGEETVSYICTTYNRGKGCSRHSVKEEVLLKLVENSIRLYRDMTGGIFKAACALRTNQVNKNEIVNCDSKILELQEEKAKYSRLVLTLSDNLVKGIINKEDYEMFRKKYMDHMEEIEESIKAQEAYVSEILEHKFLCDQWMEKFLEMPDIGKIDRDLVLRYIEKIIVYEDKKIDIRFRFQDELEIASRVAEKLNRTVRTVEDV